MASILALLLTGATSAGMVYLGHRFGLSHFHVIGGIPLGAVVMGAGAAIGAALAIRLTGDYDTAGFRILAQCGGLAAYVAAVAYDYQTLQLTVGGKRFLAPELIHVLRYLQMLIDNGSAAFTAQLPAWVTIPPQIGFWIGGARLIIEVVGAVVATGWMISLLTDVPFCWRSRRFYELRFLVESANTAAVREWEQAMHQRRPVEGRAILARVREGKVDPSDRSWMRIAVHQCPTCRASRVRIERRRRGFGIVRTEPTDEIVMDAARGSALLAT